RKHAQLWTLLRAQRTRGSTLRRHDSALGSEQEHASIARCAFPRRTMPLPRRVAMPRPAESSASPYLSSLRPCDLVERGRILEVRKVSLLLLKCSGSHRAPQDFRVTCFRDLGDELHRTRTERAPEPLGDV